MMEMMRTALLKEVRQHGFSENEIEAYAEMVEQRREDPYLLVPRLIAERFAVMEEGR
jgi:LAO/AO transport system kinase